MDNNEEHWDEAFDDIFFAKHGVGDMPVDKALAPIRYEIDPNDPTAQEMAFCRLLIKGLNRIDAYIQAFGYEGDEISRNGFSVAARRIMERPRVVRYHYNLLEQVKEFEQEDVQKLISELNEDRQLARDLGQPSAAIAAVKAKANLLGLENSTVNNTTVNISISDEQKNKILSRVANKMLPKHDESLITDAEFKEV